MTQDIVLLAIDPRGVATVTLNRPEIGNAYNAAMLEALIAGLERLASDPAVRCLVVRGARWRIIRRRRISRHRSRPRGPCNC